MKILVRATMAAAAIALAAVVLTGSAAGGELMPVKLGINKLGAMTNVWVASRDGIFKAHGLDVEIIEIPLTSQSIRVLQAKAVDIARQSPGRAMGGKDQGFDLVLVGQHDTPSHTQPACNALVIPAGSTVTSLKDLK